METPLALQQTSGFASSSAFKAGSKTERATSKSRARPYSPVAENVVLMELISINWD